MSQPIQSQERPSRQQLLAMLIRRGREFERRIGPEHAERIRKIFRPLEIDRCWVDECEEINGPPR